MNRVFTSLCVFAFAGFVLSSGVSVLGTAIHNLQTAFGDQSEVHRSILSYDSRV